VAQHGPVTAAADDAVPVSEQHAHAGEPSYVEGPPADVPMDSISVAAAMGASSADGGDDDQIVAWRDRRYRERVACPRPWATSAATTAQQVNASIARIARRSHTTADAVKIVRRQVVRRPHSHWCIFAVICASASANT
jgi:hypothetical protein